MTIAAGLLPVFFALAVGFAAGKSGLIGNEHVDGFNTLVMTIALPIALFTILAGADRDDVIEHGAVAGVVLLVMAVTYAGVYALQTKVQNETAPSSAIQALTVAFPNTAAIGLPLADSVLGSTGRLAVAVSLAVGAIFLNPVTMAILERRLPARSGGRRPSIPLAVMRALRTPVVIAPILGLIWVVTGLPFPSLLQSALNEIGTVTAGLALFLTGLVLSAQRLALSRNIAVSVLIGDLARPLLAIAVVTALGLSGQMAAEVVLLMAVPSGFFGVLLAVSHRLDARLSGATLFYSTAFSVVTLTATILILPSL